MARILDAQRLAETKLAHPGEAVPAADAPKSGVVEAVSFIEVGGLQNGLQASADVLAAPPRRAHTEAAPSVQVAQPEPPCPTLIETGPLFVAFRPCQPGPSIPFPDLICYHQPDHPASGRYRHLLAQMLPDTNDIATQAILFVGLAPGVGTTTALLNLAVSAAQEGRRRVAVFDLNIRRPAVAKRIGVAPGGWVDEVLAGRAALETVLRPTRIEGLFALCPEVRDEKATSPSAEAVRWILSWLRQHFDLILIDAPSWSENPMTSAADAVFLVAPEDSLSDSRLSSIAREVARQGGPLRGVIQTGRAALTSEIA
jgi:Mrp family chromosome partitioning ATPase